MPLRRKGAQWPQLCRDVSEGSSDAAVLLLPSAASRLGGCRRVPGSCVSFSSVSWRTLFHPVTSYAMVNLRAVGASGLALHSSPCSAPTAGRGAARRGAEPPAAEGAGSLPRPSSCWGEGGRGDFGSDMPEVRDGVKQFNQKKGLFRQDGRFLLLPKVGLPGLSQGSSG